MKNNHPSLPISWRTLNQEVRWNDIFVHTSTCIYAKLAHSLCSFLCINTTDQFIPAAVYIIVIMSHTWFRSCFSICTQHSGFCVVRVAVGPNHHSAFLPLLKQLQPLLTTIASLMIATTCTCHLDNHHQDQSGQNPKHWQSWEQGMGTRRFSVFLQCRRFSIRLSKNHPAILLRLSPVINPCTCLHLMGRWGRIPVCVLCQTKFSSWTWTSWTSLWSN